MSVLCRVFRVHRSSYRYQQKRPAEPDAEQISLRSQVLEYHNASHGSAGARSIASMTADDGIKIGRWLAAKLMTELGLVSCQQPKHRYKRGGQEIVGRTLQLCWIYLPVSLSDGRCHFRRTAT